MITNKELGYVSSWASKTPYPGINYATYALEKLKEAYKEYNTFYRNIEYDIVLSNGEQILFEIMSMNLCHMLGIDSKNLLGDYFKSFKKDVLQLDPQQHVKAYDLLTAIIDNVDKVLAYDYDKKGIIINYYRVMVKCSIFEKLSDFSKFNFGVINLNKEIYTEKTNSIFNGSSKKLLYCQSNESTAPYFMMGILPNSNDDESLTEKYVVETLFAPTNYQDFISNQQVVIPTQILRTTSEYMTKVEATPAEKIALLNVYRAIIKEHNLPNCLDIYGDYENILATQAGEKRVFKKE